MKQFRILNVTQTGACACGCNAPVVLEAPSPKPLHESFVRSTTPLDDVLRKGISSKIGPAPKQPTSKNGYMPSPRN